MTNMNGKACNHDNVYTKTNKRTGKVYAVKLCNPYEGESSVAQTAQRTKFGVMNAAVSAFIAAGKAAVKAGTDSDAQVAYLKALAAFNNQHKYATLRGMLMSRNCVYDAQEGTASVVVGGSTVSIATGGGSEGSGSEGGSAQTYTLNVSSTGRGDVTKSPNQDSYAAGTQVTLTAVPDTGKDFVEWSDGSTDNPRVITMSKNWTLVASFEE